MKSFDKVLKKPIFIAIIGLLVTTAIIAALVTLLILPQYDQYNKTNASNNEIESKIEKVTTNINLVKDLDSGEIQEFNKVISTFYPTKGDHLHFATLNELLANSLGLNITSFTVGAATASRPTTAPSIGPSAGSSSSSTPTQTPTQPTVGNPNSLVISVSYKGAYEAIESFIRGLNSLDRVVGISKASLMGLENDSEISANVTYNLPLSENQPVAASGENLILLNDGDLKTLKDLESRIEFFAKPAQNPLGKNNPFQ